MTLYVDSSAFLKRYLEEPDRDRFVAFLAADPAWASARHTFVEVRRILARDEVPASGDVRRRFEDDWSAVDVIELDEPTCSLAADLAESTGARTLDALHLAAAQRAGEGAMPFLTADLRQAQIARSLGWVVLGT